MIKRALWNVLGYLLIGVGLVSCQAQGRLYVSDTQQGDVQVSIDIQSDFHTIMMQYMEDADLLFDHPVADDIVPSSLQEMIALIRPYVDTAMIIRSTYNRINVTLQINDLDSTARRLQANQFGFVAFDREKRRLRLQMGAWERRMIYESIPNLPEMPMKWNRASRKKYIDELANMFGSTKKEKDALQKAFSDAIIVLQLDGQDTFTLHTAQGLSHNAQQVRVALIDFMLGEEWIELSW
ncbi:hypothetical protein PVA44_02605 [Entomospira nematocerorum]|uniref:Uncharacterized protein n=1 Tax=Entomospira nematocerorum TaxID=2719987 RepID=A0A968GC10_9SPIO|nr:hypothetical protein [Entomospira nematocera]NIZ47075.1 hypothetical protein [Entomospira nematocera]WDI34380.1 hypothetical protein PVA44_02605 [Entomospira nematocera]